MAVYMQKTDKRNTSGGVTPNKAIRRSSSASPKKTPPMGGKSAMRRPQGK